jgi:hypothetical protein
MFATLPTIYFLASFTLEFFGSYTYELAFNYSSLLTARTCGVFSKHGVTNETMEVPCLMT